MKKIKYKRIIKKEKNKQEKIYNKKTKRKKV